MNANITSRDGYIEGQALLYAIAHIQSLPERKQEFSNMCDMCAIARERIHPDALLMNANSVFVHTGLKVDIWPEADDIEDAKKAKKAKAYRANFLAAFDAYIEATTRPLVPGEKRPLPSFAP